MGRSVLFVAAMESEVRPLRKGLRAVPFSVAGLDAYRLERPASLAVVAQIGVGPAMATRRTERLLDALPFDLVVVSGIAGGLDLTLPVGTVVSPTVVHDLDSATDYVPVPLPGQLAHGVLASSREFIVDDGRLDELRRREIVAIDMETAAVAGVCRSRGVAFSAVRVISDRPSDGMVDTSVFELLREDGSTDALAAARLVLSHPRRLPALARLAKESSAAAKRAADVALRAR